MAEAATPLRPTPPEPVGPKVYSAIAAVMAELSKEGIAKSRKTEGGGPKYSFRGIDDVYNALAPILAENRLIIVPQCINRECVERKSNSGGALFYVTVEAEFSITSAEDGSSVTARTYGEALDSGDKATNKAMSAAYKYMAMQTFCIPTEGDNDADATNHQVAPRQPATAQQQRPTTAELPISERVLRAQRALTEAPDLATLEQRFAAMSKLCAELSTSNPGLLGSIERTRDDRKAAIAAAQPLSPFDDEIPF